MVASNERNPPINRNVTLCHEQFILRDGQVLLKASLVERLKARECELCGATDDLVMHHVRKLKNLQGKESWERHMIARKRKTIAVCRSCHKKIHDGKID